MQSEISLRQNLFSIGKPELAEYSFSSAKTIKLKYFNGGDRDIAIQKMPVRTIFRRMLEYADLLTKLKYVSDESEGTILYGTDVYSNLIVADRQNQLDSSKSIINIIYDSDKLEIYIKKTIYDQFNALLKDIHEKYERHRAKIEAK